MPFALSVVSGDSTLDECPLLTGDDVAALKTSMVRSDWREELVLKLREEIRRISFADIAEELGAEVRDGVLLMKCLGRDFSITPDGDIITQGRITPWIKILLLHYIRTSGKGGLTGKWVSYSELRGGMVKISSFQRDCEEPMRELFERDFDKASTALARLGAEKQEGFPTPHAWQLFLLPRIPVMVLYWPKEEDFPARIKILFDASADRFLDAESIIFLGEGLVKNMEMMY